MVPDAAQRELFLTSLSAAISNPSARTRIIITMRADFLDRLLSSHQLAAHLSDNIQYIPALDTSDLRQIIAQPAASVGIQIEPDLIQDLIDQVHAQPGSLPLLQYTLTELFDHRSGTTITRQSYQESGQLGHTLARRADQIYQSFTQPQQHQLRQIFLRLIAPGEGTQDTRRRVRLADLASLVPAASPAQPADARQPIRLLIQTFRPTQPAATSPAAAQLPIRLLLEPFRAASLLTFDQDPATYQSTVEFAHEALITQWETLRSWLTQVRSDLHTQQQLAAAAAEWHAGRREQSYLATGAKLALFSQLLHHPDIVLTDPEKQFLKRSTDRQQLRALGTNALITMLMIALACTIFLTWHAQAATERATQKATENEQLQTTMHARQLAAQSINSSKDQPDLASLLGIAASNITASSEITASLLTSITANPSIAMYLRGHTHWVESVAFSADGTILASASDDGTIRLWDPQHGISLYAPLQGNQNADDTPISIQKVAFSPAGTLASGDKAGTVILWDMPAREQIRQIPHTNDGPIKDLAFSPQGDNLAIAVGSKALLYDPSKKTETIIYNTNDQSQQISSLAFNSTGSTLAIGTTTSIQLYNTTSKPTQISSIAIPSPNAIAFSPTDPNLIAYGNLVGDIYLHTTTSTPSAPTYHITGQVSDLSFNDSGTLLAIASDNRIITLLNTTDGTPHGAPLIGHASFVRGIAFRHTINPDQLASASADKAVMIWNVDAAPRIAAPLSNPGHTPHRSAISSHLIPYQSGTITATLIAAGNTDGTIDLWDIRTKQIIASFQAHNTSIDTLDFSPTNPLLASTSQNSNIYLWDLSHLPNNPQHSIMPEVKTTKPKATITALHFSPSGKKLAASYSDGTLALWDIADKKLDWQTSTDQSHIYDLTFSPDSAEIAITGETHQVSIWDAGTGQATSQTHYLTNQGYTLSWSPDSHMLAIALPNTTIELWNTDSDTNTSSTLFQHAGGIRALTFSHSGHILASGGDDGQIILLDIATKQRIGTLAKPGVDRIYSLHFDETDRHLIAFGRKTGQTDTDLTLWNLDPNVWKSWECVTIRRDLTSDEWAQYIGNTTPQQPLCLTPKLDLAINAQITGNSNTAHQLFQQLTSQAITLQDPLINNDICSYGSQFGYSAIVAPACAHSQELGQTP